MTREEFTDALYEALEREEPHSWSNVEHIGHILPIIDAYVQNQQPSLMRGHTRIKDGKRIVKQRSREEMYDALSSFIHKNFSLHVPCEEEDPDIILSDAIEELLEKRTQPMTQAEKEKLHDIERGIVLSTGKNGVRLSAQRRCYTVMGIQQEAEHRLVVQCGEVEIRIEARELPRMIEWLSYAKDVLDHKEQEERKHAQD